MGLNTPVGGPVKLAVILGGFLLVCGCVLPPALAPILSIPLTLSVGWVQYLGRVLPQLQPDPWAVVSAVVCLVGVALGGHAFLRWLYAATDPASNRRWPWKWTLQLVTLVVLMFVAGIAVTGMIHQTGWLIRSPEPLMETRMGLNARIVSINNLKQIGIAAHNSEQYQKCLPRSRFDTAGRPLHSWQTDLLPFVEQENLYRQIDLTKPWTHPDNAEPMGTQLKVFLNPQVFDGRITRPGISHYAGNVHVVLGDAPRTLASFPQGTSNVVLAGEVSHNVRAWGDPLNARDPRLGAAGHPDGFGGPNGKPAQFVMLDGSVRTFDPKELADLAGQVPE